MRKMLGALILAISSLAALGQTQINGRVITPTVYFIEGSAAPNGNCSTSFNYGVVYFDHTGFNLWYCTNGGWTEATTAATVNVTGTTALATNPISSGICQPVSAGSVNSSAATGAHNGQ
jgi:hypothetical protein